MIIEEDVFLEHFGRKGMRWGVRNKEQTTSDKQAPSHKKLKIVGAVVATAAVAAGAAFVANRISKNRKIKLRDLAEQEHWKKVEETGIAWRSGFEKNWHYGLPGRAMSPENKVLLKKTGKLTWDLNAP